MLLNALVFTMFFKLIRLKGDQISTNISNLLQIARALPIKMSILPSYTCDDYQILSTSII